MRFPSLRPYCPPAPGRRLELALERLWPCRRTEPWWRWLAVLTEIPSIMEHGSIGGTGPRGVKPKSLAPGFRVIFYKARVVPCPPMALRSRWEHPVVDHRAPLVQHTMWVPRSSFIGMEPHGLNRALFKALGLPGRVKCKAIAARCHPTDGRSRLAVMELVPPEPRGSFAPTGPPGRSRPCSLAVVEGRDINIKESLARCPPTDGRSRSVANPQMLALEPPGSFAPMGARGRSRP